MANTCFLLFRHRLLDIWTLPTENGLADQLASGEPLDPSYACRTKGGEPAASRSWLTEQLAPGTDETEYSFKIKPEITLAGPKVFQLDGDDPNADAIAMFCIRFAKTDPFQAEDPIVSFVEIGVVMRFKFDGNFELDDFSTLALDPTVKSAEREISVEVRLCPGGENSFNQLQNIPICLCPVLMATAPVASIAKIQKLEFTQDCCDEDCTLKWPDECDPPVVAPFTGTGEITNCCDEACTLEWPGECDPPVEAPFHGVSQIVIEDGVPKTGAVAVDCFPSQNRCCQVTTQLNDDFFPPDPTLLQLKLKGLAYIQLGDTYDGSFEAGDKNGPEPNEGDTGDDDDDDDCKGKNCKGKRYRRNRRLPDRGIRGVKGEKRRLLPASIATVPDRSLVEEWEEAAFDTDLQIVVYRLEEEPSAANEVGSFLAFVGAAGAAMVL